MRRCWPGPGGAVLLLEPDCSGQTLYRQAADLLEDGPRRDKMIRSLRGLGIPDAG